MLFKRKAFAIMGLVLACALPACSLRVGEEVEQKKIVVNPAKEGCLANAGDVLDRYFEGKIDEAELESFWACTEKAFGTFVQNTQGGGGTYYSPEELASFLSKYFLKGKPIEPKLLSETMVLKQGLVGGSADRLSRAELEQVMAILRSVHEQSLKLRAFMPITPAGFRERKVSADQFELALATFEKSMLAMSQTLANAQGAYTIDHMADFLRALKSFLYTNTKVRTNWADVAIKWTDALRPAKAIFVAPPKDEIRASDWARIYELAPRYYGLYLRASFYLTPGNTYTHGPGLNRLETLFTDFTSLMELVLSHRANGTIDSSEVDELLVALGRNGMLPETLQLESARSIARALFGRIFSGTNPAAATAQDSYTISKVNFARLEEGFLFATEGLRGLEAFYRDRLREKFDSGTLNRSEVEALPVDALLRYTAEKNDVSRAALESLRASARDVRNVFPGDAARVVVPTGEEPSELSLAHLEKIHLLRSVNRVLLHGYAGNRGEYLSEEQVGTMADDFFPFLQDIGFGDAGLRQSLSSRLLEASLFLYSSDGETGLSMTEAIELETLLVSTLGHASEMHEKIAAACKVKGAVPATCYRLVFMNYHARIWDYIPGLANYASGLSKEEQMKLFALMESFLRKKNPAGAEAPFTKSDTQAFILMPYYVELLFSRFDRDRNGVFDNAEAEAAYPVFQPFLKKKSMEHGLTSPKDHKAVFNFLLAYQELPTNMKATWIWRRYLAGDKKFRVDRGQVVQIFQKLLSL
jgi:hypothetical protein